MQDLGNRNPSVLAIAKHFSFDHLPDDLKEVSKPIHDLAEKLIQDLPDGPELTTGLRKLLEAKDCFVRSKIEGKTQ